METVLHDYWRSTASYRVRIALNLANIPYRAVPVDLVAGRQVEEAHLARNPQGFVPVLEIDGLRLTQSLAILEYLDETRSLGLLPADAADRARVRALAQVIAADTHPVCNLSVVSKLLELTPACDSEQTRRLWMTHFIRRGLAAYERLLDHPSRGRLSHGDNPSLADICLIPQLYNASRWAVHWNDLEHICSVARNLQDNFAFVKAQPDFNGKSVGAP